MNDERLASLLSAVTEARVREKKCAAALVSSKAAHDAICERWSAANAGLNSAEEELNNFIRDQTMSDADAIFKASDA